MPKKLAELVSKGDALQRGYDECITGLRKCAQSGSQHESMIGEGEEELKHRIDILVKGGKKGTLVKDFDTDAEAKSFIAGIEDQKAAYIKQCKTYWDTRDKLDKILADVKTTVADADAIIAEKKKHVFPSASIAAIQDFRNDLDNWHTDVSTDLQKLLRQTSLPKDKRLAWAAPGSTSKAKITDLHNKQNLHDMAELLKFVDGRAKTDKTRANTH
ncbi:MAG: hypothetical protein R3D25_13625, partial [Geminicoccaceae bacterium]